MVQPEAPQATTRLQSRIEAQDEKIQSLSAQMQEISTAVGSMKELMEKLFTGFQNLQAKQPEGFYETEPPSGGPVSEVTTGSGSTTQEPFLDGCIRPNHFEAPLFSMPRVKLPPFDGNDPRGWISKAELYYKVHQTPQSHKMKLALMCMDGVALNWFTNLLLKQPGIDWGAFRNKLMVRFSGTKFRNAHEALRSLFQTDDIEDYNEEFEALSALIPRQTEEQSIGMYLRGLKEEVKNWVRALNPTTIDQAMEFARHVYVAIASPSDKAKTKGVIASSTYQASSARPFPQQSNRVQLQTQPLVKPNLTQNQYRPFPSAKKPVTTMSSNTCHL